ncbi:MAG TPA: site-2 protease family protein [Candidatus Krumholzibacteriaceae bacterium]|nr:site-2 protease family protein [Candidatus Krumholzibacteriaceae bacterium]
MSDMPLPVNQGFAPSQFEDISRMVESEFSVEDKLLELGVPTFYVKLREDSKTAFLRLIGKLEDIEAVPVLRRLEGRTVLRVIPKPRTRKNRPIINILLLAATVVTTFVSGYLLSSVLPKTIPNPYVGAVEFTVAILAILGAHEMGHKLTSERHHVDATYPYFIPGLPPIGTFGAVIQQKSLSPNKDALFDLGASGPVIGFIVTIIVTAIGVMLSPIVEVSQLPSNTAVIQVPILFEILERALIKAPAAPGNYSMLLHPIAFAGWVGMVVTMLNLLPTGMLDGGHTVRSLLGDKARWGLTFLSFAVLLYFGYWVMLLFVLFLAAFRHPGPLDDVSKLSTGRKIFSLLLVAIFVLSIAPLTTL